MLTIYGNPLSTCTRKVLMTLAETATPYEFSVVDFGKGEHKQPTHLHRQPFGQVPALDDDGFALYESRPMCRYINDKVGGKLVPHDLKARAVMEQWMSVETSNFTPPAMTFIFHHVFKRPQENAELEAAGKRLETALGIMDAHLGKHAWFAGDAFSLADISFMPYVEYLTMTPVKDTLEKFPHVHAWWTKASGRATWRKVAGR